MTRLSPCDGAFEPSIANAKTHLQLQILKSHLRDYIDLHSIHLGVSENSVPLNPMVLLIIIPIKWLFHWEYTQHFQTNPFSHYKHDLWDLTLSFFSYFGALSLSPAFRVLRSAVPRSERSGVKCQPRPSNVRRKRDTTWNCTVFFLSLMGMYIYIYNM